MNIYYPKLQFSTVMSNILQQKFAKCIIKLHKHKGVIPQEKSAQRGMSCSSVLISLVPRPVHGFQVSGGTQMNSSD